MCTVSVVPTARGFRLACNRDERRTRPRALAPRIHRNAGRRAWWPCDPQSGGTWIGVNDNGLAMALLNRAAGPAVAPRPSTLSRGVLIPQLLGASHLDEAITRAWTQLQPRDGSDQFEAFTLLMIERRRTAIVEHRSGMTAIAQHPLDQPLMFTSSSLGDAVVDPPRRRLLTQLLQSRRDPLDAQARFHRHRWPNRPQVSVRMSRADAATVSHTVIDVSPAAVAVRYMPTI